MTTETSLTTEFNEHQIEQMLNSLPLAKQLLPIITKDSKEVITDDLAVLGDWVKAENKRATAVMLAKGIIYKKVQEQQDFDRANLVNWIHAEWGVAKERIRESLRTVELISGLPDEFRQPVAVLPVRSIILLSKQELGTVKTWLNEDILNISLSQRKFKKHIEELTSSAKRESRMEKQLTETQKQLAETKERLAYSEGRKSKFNIDAFYYRQQTASLSLQTDKILLGFTEVLDEIDSDFKIQKVRDAVLSDYFSIFQGLVGKYLANFELLKQRIPEHCQSKEMALKHHYSDDEIIEMQTQFSYLTNSSEQDKIIRQASARNKAKTEARDH